MSEMVERVAKVMAAVAIVENTGRDFDEVLHNIGDYDVSPWHAPARAAIEAMREPTDAMRREGIAGIARDHGDVTGIYFDLNIVFRDMIDEALK